jgi:two-component system sensor histidine kinase/response regulator
VRLPGVDLADGLGHLAGNREAYRRLLLQFGRGNRLLESLRAALEAGDRQSAVRAAHSLKSVAGNLGAKDLSGTAAEAEAALKAGSETPLLLDTLAERFEAVIGGIMEWAAVHVREGTEASGETALDDAALREGLARLRALVAANDAAALECCEDLAGHAPAALREALAAVGKALAGYDFEAALAGMEALSRP